MSENMDQSEAEDSILDYNLGAYYGDNSDLDETDRLKFAEQILFFLFILIVFVFSASYILINYGSENRELVSIINTILDITKTVVPSTVTLVLGFYFIPVP